MKLKHPRWRDLAYEYIRENGPRTAIDLSHHMKTKRGLPLKHAPHPASIGALLHLDPRFTPTTDRGKSAVWGVVE